MKKIIFAGIGVFWASQGFSEYDAGTYSGVVQNIVNQPYIDDAFEGVQNRIWVVAMALVPTFYFITLAYNYAKAQVEGLTASSVDALKWFDWMDFFRVMTLYIMVAIYPTISNFLADSVDVLNKSTTPGTYQAAALNELAQQSLQSQNMTEEEKEIMMLKKKAYNSEDPQERAFAMHELKERGEVSDQEFQTWAEGEAKRALDAMNNDGIFTMLKKIFNLLSNPLNWLIAVMNALTLIFLSIVRIIITFLSVYGFKFMLVVGPLAFAFSVIPLWKEKAAQWLSVTMNVGLVICTMNIIDHFMYDLYADYFTNIPSAGADDLLAATGINFAMVAMYLLSFWLTSKWVGSSEGGKIVSKGVMAAGAAVGAAVAGAMMAGGGAAGGAAGGGAAGGGGGAGGQVVGSAAKMGSDVMKGIE